MCDLKNEYRPSPTPPELRHSLKVANYVLRGQEAPTIGNCVAYLVATSIRTKEAGEFEQRLAAIETRLKQLMT